MHVFSLVMGSNHELTNFKSLDLDILVGVVEALRNHDVDHLSGVQFRSLKKTGRRSSEVHCGEF
jgi:hypothetical protein